jgi:hypothetical protein
MDTLGGPDCSCYRGHPRVFVIPIDGGRKAFLVRASTHPASGNNHPILPDLPVFHKFGRNGGMGALRGRYQSEEATPVVWSLSRKEAQRWIGAAF